MSSYRKPSWEPKAEIQMRNKGGWHGVAALGGDQ